MNKLPLWAWDEDAGKHVLFPFHLLTTVDGVQGMAFPSYVDTTEKQVVFSKFRKRFSANPMYWPDGRAWSVEHGYFFPLRDWK